MVEAENLRTIAELAIAVAGVSGSGYLFFLVGLVLLLSMAALAFALLLMAAISEPR
jgi:hypothetical protein